MSEKKQFLDGFVKDLIDRANELGFTGSFDAETHMFEAYAADGTFVCSFKVDAVDSDSLEEGEDQTWMEVPGTVVDQDVPDGVIVH